LLQHERGFDCLASEARLLAGRRRSAPAESAPPAPAPRRRWRSAVSWRRVEPLLGIPEDRLQVGGGQSSIAELVEKLQPPGSAVVPQGRWGFLLCVEVHVVDVARASELVPAAVPRRSRARPGAARAGVCRPPQHSPGARARAHASNARARVRHSLRLSRLFCSLAVKTSSLLLLSRGSHDTQDLDLISSRGR
jgi:hypothetical protein